MQEEIMIRMEPTLKRKWIAALRSGEFKQAKHKLFNVCDRGWCCLGVLAVQLGATLDSEGILRMNNTPVTALGAEYLQTEYGGLDEITQSHLSRMNDGSWLDKPSNFNKIADWIEENL